MKKLAITLFGLSTIFGTSAMAAETAQATSNSQTPQQAAASYECAQDKSVIVNYAFNESGVPTEAIFEQAQGDVKHLKISPSESSQNALVFTSDDGYRLNASISDENTLFAQNIDISNASNETIFQGCQANSGS